MPKAAPSALARESFSSLEDVMMARMPIARANCNPKIETPPVPCSSTVSPGLSLACSTIACQTVTAAQGSVAPSSSDRCAGIFTAPSSSSTAYSASMPSMPPPSALLCASAAGAPPLEEISGNVVANFHSRHPRTGLNHFAGAVRKRDEIVAYRHAIATAGNSEIAEIERACLHLHQHLPISGLGIG